MWESANQKKINKSSVPGNVYDVILAMQVDGNSKYKGIGKLKVRLLIK